MKKFFDVVKSDGTGKLDVILPCGLLYKGNLHKKAKVKPVIGRVQRLLGRPEIRKSPSKIITTMIANCVEIEGLEMSNFIANKLLVFDREFLIFCLNYLDNEEATLSNRITCSVCGADNQVDINVGDIEVYEMPDVEIVDGVRVFKVESKGTEYIFRFANGFDQEQLDRYLDNYPEYVFRLIESTEINKKLPLSVLDEMSKREIEFLMEKIVDSSYGLRLPEEKCYACGATLSIETKGDLLKNL